MSKILVFGHKNPDTDAVTSAISFSYLQNELGKDTEPVALGELTDEIKYALNHFNVEAPRVVTESDEGVTEVMLVDHNEPMQSIDDIEELTVLSVVDHHRIDGFHTSSPLYYRAEPVGCTNTIILKLFKENQIAIPSDIAGLMLSAIISDTLLFKSPTCTEEDEKAAKELAEIAKVDLEEYGLNLLKAGTNNDEKSAYDIVDGDAKNFDLNEHLVRVGQVNVVDFDELLARKEELLNEMTKQNSDNSYELFVLLITNILNSDSIALVTGNHLEKVEAAFNTTIQDNQIELPGVVSRKKQVIPQLTESFENE